MFAQIPAMATLSLYPNCFFLALLNLCPEDRGTRLLRNVGRFLLEHKALPLRTEAHQFFKQHDKKQKDRTSCGPFPVPTNKLPSKTRYWKENVREDEEEDVNSYWMTQRYEYMLELERGRTGL
jgi:hypothetical protein